MNKEKDKKKIKSRHTANDNQDGNPSFDGLKSEGFQRHNDLCCPVIKDQKSVEGKLCDETHHEDLSDLLH